MKRNKVNDIWLILTKLNIINFNSSDESNANYATVSFVHNVSSFYTPVSSIVIDVLSSRCNTNFSSISFGHNISSSCLFRTIFIWEERIWEKVKILKPNINDSIVALAHNISSCYSPVSSIVVDILSSRSNVNFGSITLGHNIPSFCFFGSSFIWEERIWEKV